jgi:hypothetical protein
MIIGLARVSTRLDSGPTVFQGSDANLTNLSSEGFLKTLQEAEVFGARRQDIASSCDTGISANQSMYVPKGEHDSPWKKIKTL